MKISDYADEINKIEPSESFISETEALMKKVRDEKKSAGTYRTGDSILSFCLTGFNSRRKELLHTAAAAAAVLVCVAAIKIYSDGKTSSDAIVGETMPASYEETSVTGSAAPEISSETEYEEEIYEEEEDADFNLTVDDGGPELPAETTVPIREEIIDDTLPRTSAQVMIGTEKNGEVTSVPVTAAVTDNEVTSASHRKRTKSEETSARTESTVISETEPPAALETTENVTLPAENEVIYGDETTYAIDAAAIEEEKYEEYSEEYYEDEDDDNEIRPDVYGGIYESAEAEGGNPLGGGSGEEAAPVYTSGFDSEETDAETEAYSPYSSYGSLAYGSFSASYGNSSDAEVVSAADEVYVPDSLNMLEEGSFYAEITSGFDYYDEETGSISGGNTQTISEDDTATLSALISSVINTCYKNKAVYSAKRTDMPNYRNKIIICSAIEGERGAVMFEIIYDDQTLIINRYDNGTESSEIYMMNISFAYQLDETVNNCLS